MSYKEEHVNFVSGHNGTSFFEISMLAATTSATLLLREVLLLKMSYSIASKLRVRFLVDFVLFAMLLATIFSALADKVLLVFSFYLLTSLFLVSLNSNATSSIIRSLASPVSSFKSVYDVPLSRRPSFVTNFRATVNLATAVCILAVDFAVFPRRFCKVETFGKGLMDAGVASFVLSNSIVAPEARGRLAVARCWSEVVERVSRSVVGSWPLLVLGFGRLISVKGSDYHEVFSEYGVHWNFFFTLSVVRIASTFILCFVSTNKSWLVACVIAGLHEFWLQHGLKAYVFYGSDGKGGRSGFIDSNREGIFSCPGYIAIYFAGVQLGQFLLTPRQNFGHWMKALLILVVVNIIFWCLLFISEKYLDLVSRRLANVTYIIWMLVYNIQILVEMLAVDLGVAICKGFNLLRKIPVEQEPRRNGDPRTFHLLEAINRNGLAYFLLANLLTGFVNMSVATLQTPPVLSLVIIFGYLFVLSAVISLLHIFNISVKFW